MLFAVESLLASYMEMSRRHKSSEVEIASAILLFWACSAFLAKTFAPCILWDEAEISRHGLRQQQRDSWRGAVPNGPNAR